MADLVLSEFCVDRSGFSIVRHVSLNVPAGQVTVLLGANGAGKTTLLEGISGIVTSCRGSLKLGDASMGFMVKPFWVDSGFTNQQIGLVSQVVGEGEALRAARATAAQIGKFDRKTAVTAKKFIKPIPHDELVQEIDIFCDLFARPAVEAGLRKFVESTDSQPYLP